MRERERQTDGQTENGQIDRKSRGIEGLKIDGRMEEYKCKIRERERRGIVDLKIDGRTEE